nr:hypothetical protein [Tanacetum cinerariifolium]
MWSVSSSKLRVPKPTGTHILLFLIKAFKVILAHPVRVVSGSVVTMLLLNQTTIGCVNLMAHVVSEVVVAAAVVKVEDSNGYISSNIEFGYVFSGPRSINEDNRKMSGSSSVAKKIVSALEKIHLAPKVKYPVSKEGVDGSGDTHNTDTVSIFEGFGFPCYTDHKVLEMMRTRFSKLLLGEDMSGVAKVFVQL